MNKQEIIEYIVSRVFQNTEEKITGENLQSVLIQVINQIFSDNQVVSFDSDDYNIIIKFSDGFVQKIPISSKLPPESIAQYEIGNIKVGDDLSGMYVSDIVEKILIDEVQPLIKKFSIYRVSEDTELLSDTDYVFQLGEPIQRGLEIGWEYNDKYYKPNTTTLTNTVTLTQYFKNTNVTRFLIPTTMIGLDKYGTYDLKLELYDITNKLYTTILPLRFGYKVYSGSNSSETLSFMQIRQLSNTTVYDNLPTKYTLPGNGYGYIILPTVLNNKEWYARNMRTNFEVPFIKHDDIVFVNDFGISIKYSIYRTVYLLTNPINILIEYI